MYGVVLTVGPVGGLLSNLMVLAVGRSCRSVIVVVDIEVPTRKVGRRPSKWYPSSSIERLTRTGWRWKEEREREREGLR